MCLAISVNNVDSVVFSELTPKHIDVAELASCTLFEEKPKSTLLMQPKVEGNKQVYPIPVPDFKFDCFVKAESELVVTHSAEIVFAIDQPVTVTHTSGESLVLQKGESAFIPAYAQRYTLNSEGRVARVYN